jgi:putative ABC transport system permease protein
MFKSYLLVALRNLKKQKIFSLINIIGMAVGMAGFAIFALTAGVKLNADKFHKNADNIYSIVQVLPTANKDEQHTAFTAAPLLPALRSEFPEIKDALRIFSAGKMSLRRQRESFYEHNILFVDPNFLTFFTYEMITGNPETALSEPNSIVLSEAAAFKYFGSSDPIGKVLTLEKKTDLKVTGILKNIPRTSSIRFEFLVSMETSRTLFNLMNDWKVNQHTTFVLLPGGYDKSRLEEKLPAFIDKYIADSPVSPKRMYLFPLPDFRLKGGHITSYLASSNVTSVIIVLSIGVLLLVVVCINFINLSVARYMQRTKEVGLIFRRISPVVVSGTAACHNSF